MTDRHIITRTYTSPCGTLLLGVLHGELCLCDWTDGPRHQTTLRRTLRMLGATICDGNVMAERHHGIMDDDGTADVAVRQLDEYFGGRRQTLNIPLLTAGTDFQRRVWQELTRIPYATTTTYAAVAQAMGRPEAVRAVAGAIGANPLSLFIPCHRVVGSDGTLTGYAGGLQAKSYLIGMERRHHIFFS